MGFFCQLAVFFLFVGCVDGSCLSLLTGDQCSTIQDAGQQLAKLLKKANIALQEFSDRCVDNSMKIIVSTLKDLKVEARKINLVNSRITPIESSAFTALESTTSSQVTSFIELGNFKFWEIIVDLSKDAGSNVAQHLFTFQHSVKRSPSKRSLTGVISPTASSIYKMLIKIEEKFQQISSSMFNMFANSLKILIGNTMHIDVDNIKIQTQKYLFKNIHALRNSAIMQIKLVLEEATEVIETIDGIVEPYKKIPTQLLIVLEPAMTLTHEQQLQIHLQKKGAALKFQKLAQLLKTTCNNIRYNR